MRMLWSRAKRIAAGWKLRQVARETKIDPGNLSKFERGLLHLGTAERERLSSVLGVPAWILDQEVDQSKCR